MLGTVVSNSHGIALGVPAMNIVLGAAHDTKERRGKGIWMVVARYGDCAGHIPGSHEYDLHQPPLA